MTRVLVTNDDGIASAGLCALARVALDAGFDVTIAAPSHQSSGASASILGTQEDGRILFVRRDLPEVPGALAFSVDAAPALITLVAAHGAFGDPPDLVLSGVNRGANVGRAILHSGTVGAALTAGVGGARGLAVSLDVGLEPAQMHWDAPAPFVRSLCDQLLEAAPGTVFNLNVPNSPEPTELREGPLAPFGIVQTTTTAGQEGDDDSIRLAVADLPDSPDSSTDAGLLRSGFATVTNLSSVSEADRPALSRSAALHSG